MFYFFGHWQHSFMEKLCKNSTVVACFHISSANKCTKWHLHATVLTHAVRMTHAQSGSHISPLSAHPARTSAPCWPKFRLLGGRELWFGPFQNALLHSLLGAMFNWKFNLVNEFDRCICDRTKQLNGTWWKPASNISNSTPWLFSLWGLVTEILDGEV